MSIRKFQWRIWWICYRKNFNLDSTDSLTVFVGASGSGSPVGLSGYGAGRGGQRQNFYTLNQAILLTGMLAAAVALVRMVMVVMAVVAVLVALAQVQTLVLMLEPLEDLEVALAAVLV